MIILLNENRIYLFIQPENLVHNGSKQKKIDLMDDDNIVYFSSYKSQKQPKEILSFEKPNKKKETDIHAHTHTH